MDEKRLKDPQLLVFKTVTAAHCMTGLILAVVAWYLSRGQEVVERSELGNALLIAASIVWAIGYLGFRPFASRLVDPSKLQSIAPAIFLRLACYECGIIFTFVVSFLTGDPSYVYCGAMVGIFLMLRAWPGKETLAGFFSQLG